MTDKKQDAAGASQFELEVASPEMWKRVINVRIAPEFFTEQYAAELRKARKGHKRPGFRPGKVPLAMVESDLGPEVRLQAVENVIPQAYQAAVIEHKLHPVSDPFFENLKMDEGEPVSVDIVVEVRPDFELAGYDDLSLTAREKTITDKAVEDALQRLREGRAVVEKVDRAAAAGDVLKTTIVPLDDAGEPVAAKEVKDYPLEIGAEGNFAAFDEGLTGAVADDVREVTVTYPDDYFAEDLKSSTVTYRVTVQEVGKRSMPELDDAFASTLKEGQTMLELRASLRVDLQEEHDRQVERETREEIVDRLLERNTIDLPPSLVDGYLDSGVEELKRRNQYMGRKTGDADIAEYRQAGRPSAERALKAMLVIEAIQDKEKIEASEEDIEARIEQTAASNNFDLEPYKTYMAQGENRRRMSHEIAEEKTYDFLKSRAEFVEKKDKEKEKSAE